MKSKKNTWLFVLPTDSVQGSEHIVRSLASFISKGHGVCRIIILTRKKSNGWDKLEKEMEVSYLPFSHYFVGAFALIFYLAVKNYNDVRYSFSSQTIINGTLGLAKRIGVLKARVIARESNSIFHLISGLKLKIYAFFYLVGYKGSSLVITQTDFMKKQLIDALPKLSAQLNLKTISNPFNFEDIGNRSGHIDKKFENKSFLVAAGRLAPAKGFDILIDAFHSLAGKVDDMYLIILGEGSERERLNDSIKKYGLEDRVHLPGYVDNVYAYFNKAKACILSSRIEGFPNVLLQMMSQNTTVIATLSAGGIEEIPGLFTCPPENTSALENSIKEAMQTDTVQNRKIFDSFLGSRTQTAFYSEIMEYLDKN